jgi:hypothetical protein
MTEAEALAALRRKCAPDAQPQLSNDELRACLADARRYAPHAVNTEVVIGARVVSASPSNGRLYRCVAAGTTGASAPTFPLSGYMGARVSDGSAVLWEDIGPAPASPWDITRAAKLAWLMKADKDAAAMDYAANGCVSVGVF